MLIANPIYDVVFKYMMNDNKVAKLLISAIIGEEIEKLEFKPTEYESDAGERTLTVYRIDFAAKIRNAEGKLKTVVIEVQKAKYHTDIMRFRRYLGGQYASKENSVVDASGHRRAFPIISIYFIGHRLENIHSSIVKVSRDYIDCVTGDSITARDEFIECLTHDSYIVQVPELSRRRRNELETILSIFDQSSSDNQERPHTLDINEENYPGKYRPVIRALLKAASEPQVRKKMDIEDDVLENIEEMQRAIQQKDYAIKRNEDAIKQKDDAIRQKDDAIRQKNDAIKQQNCAIDRAVELLVNSGMSEEQARKQLGLAKA